MMKRITLTLVLLALSTATAAAQDIPLSQILIEGEGWKEGVESALKTLPVALTKSGAHYNIQDNKLTCTTEKAAVLAFTLPEKLLSPSDVVLWPDQGTLVLADAKGKHLWAFRVEKDYNLSAGEPYYALRVRPGEKESHVTGLTVDDKGLVYAATPLGIQVFDPTGRLCGVISKPSVGDLHYIALSGDVLLVCCGDRLFTRKIKGKGVQPAQ